MNEAHLLQHQVDFITNTSTPFLALVGGFRSGKSYALCYKMLYMMSINTQADFSLLEPTWSMVVRVLIPTMTSILEKHKIKYELNKGDGFFKIYMGNQVKTCWLLSAENYQRAAGLTLSCFGIDEADLMKKDVAQSAWNMMVSRLTKGEFMQGFCCSTPEGFSWMYEFFEENAGPDRMIIRARTRDNPFIDESYFDNLAKTHTEQQLEAYLEGKFVNLTTSSVYYQFNRKIHHTNRELLSTDSILLVGQDFNVGKCASVIAVVENGKVFVIDEITDSNNTEQTINIIKERYGNRKFIIFPDASGNSGSTRTSISDVALFRNAGFTVKHLNKNPNVKDRISAVNVMLKNANGEIKLFINTSKCRQLTKSLEQQSYDKNGSPDKSTGLDHILDALGYMIFFNWPVTGKSSLKQIF